MKRVSRLQKLEKNEEKETIKRIFWLFLISIFLLIFVFTVGVSVLGNFADFLDTVFKTQNTNIPTGSSTPPPPIIQSLPKATNEETITVSGFSNNSAKVEIYLNSINVGETEVVGGKFEFKNFRLKNGENKISLKAINQAGKASGFSQELTILLDKDEPDLKIESPQEDQTFSGNNKIKVSGETEKDAQVLANGFLANVDFNGKFEVTIPLNEGENNIEVKAQDEAGNSKIVEIKVNFNP